jgi:predicted secreted hydrolase
MMRPVAVLLALAAAAAAAVAAETVAPNGILPFAADSAGFEQATSAREFEFPGDHGPHPAFRHEWWYLTGHLAGASGERFGFDLTFFRVALARAPAIEPAPAASRWRAQQIYIAHFAVTDIARGRFRSAERYARGALGLAGAEASPLRVWVGDWSLGAPGGSWQLRAAEPGYELTLAMRPERPPVANGDRGLSQKSATPADASYYYSIPRLAVSGQLLRDGQSVSVNGHAWLDREWGSGGLGADEAGWDWFAFQFADGSELMFYSLRRRDGNQDVHSAGTWVAPDGRVRALASADVQIKVQSFWTSPRGGQYPASWKVSVPALSLSVDVRPALADQELDVRPRYWEGAVDIAGTRDTRAISGEGYVELVGYAHPP